MSDSPSVSSHYIYRSIALLKQQKEALAQSLQEERRLAGERRAEEEEARRTNALAEQASAEERERAEYQRAVACYIAEMEAAAAAGMTSLMRACQMKNEAAAAELMEATKKAGALDLQVTDETWLGVCGVRGAGR